MMIILKEENELQDDFEYDMTTGKKKPILRKLNKNKLSSMEMDELFLENY